MTPAARIHTAIDLLDLVLGGQSAEQTLTRWARANRYAGSKDRVAIRDHVYTALRCQRSFAALGGAKTGRGIMIGALRADGIDPETLFTGQGYGPDTLSESEKTPMQGEMEDLAALDCPEWLAPQLQAALGDEFSAIMQAMRQRADVFLRVNTMMCDRDGAIAALADDDIDAVAHPLSPTALRVVKNPRRARASAAYLGGMVELQDVAAQAVIDALPLAENARILDYCAGGGGKSLALAGRGVKKIFAHDLNIARLRDLPNRAKRAGADIEILDADGVKNAGKFDLVLADVPCSGSGAWRRSPDEKWRFSQEKLDELCLVQAEILREISNHVVRNGSIAYVTCSMLQAENQAQISAFLQGHPEWQKTKQIRLTPLDGGDGFFLAVLTR